MIEKPDDLHTTFSDVNKPRVLIIAFASNPVGTGEHWLGWGWAARIFRSRSTTRRTHLPASGSGFHTTSPGQPSCGSGDIELGHQISR